MNLEKPSKEKRLEERKQLKEAIRKFREQQRAIAIYRDSGFCVVCYFTLGVKKLADDVHHVYGRASGEAVFTSSKENHKSLCSLCRKHHNSVGSIRKKGSSWDFIIGILQLANDTPINVGYKEYVD